jgi:MFS family permease
MWRQYLDLPRPVHVLCLGQLINKAGTLLLPFLTLYLREDLGLGSEFPTYAFGFFGLGSIVSAIAGGHLADRIGRRIVMLLSLFGAAAVLLVFSTLTWPPAILLTTLIFGFVAEMYRPAAAAMIADIVEPKSRPRAFGLMYVSINLGFCVGPLVGGILAESSFRWLFWGDAATSSIYGLIILFAIRETLPRGGPDADGPSFRQPELEASGGSPPPPGLGHPEGATIAAIDAGRSATAPDGEIPLAHAIKRMIRDRVFMMFCLATLLTAMAFMQLMSTFPLYLQQFGVGPKIYGRLITLNAAMVVICQLPVASLITRFDRGVVIALGSVATGLSFGLLMASASIWHFALVVVVMTIGELMQAPLMQAIVGDLAPPALRGRYMGVLGMSFSIALMIGSPLGGIVLARLGGNYIWGGAFAVSMVASVLFLSIRRPVASGVSSRTR